MNPVQIGVVSVIVGLGLLLLVLLLLRLTPKLLPSTKVSPVRTASLEISAHNEAVLLIRRGGRVSYINQHARELFNFWEEEPNLEGLARRARPSEAFLALCASEGQARFSLNGRFVEGISYYAPEAERNGKVAYDAILVTLRRPQLVIDPDSPLALKPQSAGETGSKSSSSEITNRAFEIFAELSKAMAASLDLEQTLQTILESVQRLLPSDFMEAKIWDNEREHLIPFRLVGLPGVDQHVEKAPEHFKTGGGYSKYLVTNLEPLLIKDVTVYRVTHPANDGHRYPYLSYLGVPLLIAGELIGTIELASLSKEKFRATDLEVLRLLAGQAAIALNNALLYKQELERSLELGGLASLAKAVSAIRDPQDLYSRLIDSISPLLDVDILGFLVFDENRGMLVGQVPFMGIQSTVIEWYQVKIQPDTPAEEIWKSAETLIATNAPEDPQLVTLGLHHLALAAGVRHTVLEPLTSGGEMLGYLQVANKPDGTPFDQNDMRFLKIVAGQTAPIIENAKLAQQSQHRMQRAETLRRIASLTSSAATLDEILKFSILDLARLLHADIAILFLVDENHGDLKPHKSSAFGVPPEAFDGLGYLSTEDPLFNRSVTGSHQELFSGDIRQDPDILPIYQQLADELEIRSFMDVPLIIRDRGIGELVIGSTRPDVYSHGDAQTAGTSAWQLATAIERETLYSQTDQNLRQRVEQLTALTRVSRELNATLELQHLLQRVYDEVLRTTRADCGTILLFDVDAVWSGQVLEKETVVDDHLDARILLHIGDLPGRGFHPLERMVLEGGKAVSIDDFNKVKEAGDGNGGSPDQPLHPAHSGVLSALVIPIAYQGQVAGIIHLHAKTANHFGEAEREIGEALAIQAAIALGNAHRYREQVRRGELLNQRVETLSKLFEVSQVLQTDQPLEQSLESIAYGIQSATPFDQVLISIYEADKDQLVRVAGAGIPLNVMEELRGRPQPWKSVESLLVSGFQLDRSYFIPSERAEKVPQDLHTISLSPAEYQPEGEESWHPQDILIVPLFNAAGEPLGLVSVDMPRDNLRPEPSTIETLEIFSSQAGLVIESQLNVQSLMSQVERIQNELEEARAAAHKAETHLPALLQKDLEQTLAIQNLSQRARRIHAGLDIAEIVSQQATRSDMLLALGQETLSRMEFDMVMVAEPLEGGLRLSHTIGAIPPEVNPKALLGQRNPLRHCLQTGEALLVSDLNEDDEWQNTPLLSALETRSFLCLPIGDITNGKAIAGRDRSRGDSRFEVAMLAISKSPSAAFTKDDEQLFHLLSQQVSIALQNLNLLDEASTRLDELNLILDFSRQLGSMDVRKILRTLLDSALQAIPAAQSALVAIWDEKRGLLIPRAVSGYGDEDSILQMRCNPGEGIPGQVFDQRHAFLIEEVDFIRQFNLTPENLMHYRNATGGQLPVSSLAVPVMAGYADQTDGEPVDEARATPHGVIVLDNYQASGAFNLDDLAVVTSLAQQTALTLENARLYQASEQRSWQLHALTGVSTTITSSLQTEELISTLLDQLQAILPYDTGTLWLRQKDGAARIGSSGSDVMAIRAARGFEDSDQRIGLTVNVQDSQLLNEMIETSQPIWVGNVLEDPRFQTPSLATSEDLITEAEHDQKGAAIGYEHLSWLGLPLIASGGVIGVIALEKSEPNFYSPDDIQVATTFAGQAATGLENAQLYQESVNRAAALNQQTQKLAILNRLSSGLSKSLDAAQVIKTAMHEFLQIMPCTSVSALIYRDASMNGYDQQVGGQVESSHSQIILFGEYPSVDLNEDSAYKPGRVLPNIPLFERLRESQGIFNTEDVNQEAELAPLKEFLARQNTRSLLIAPLISAGSKERDALQEPRVHGMLLGHNNEPYRFNADEMELARTISFQTATALQNARLFEETIRLTEELEQRVQERTAELAREHQRAETLLRIITELSASLDLDQVLNSTLQVLSEYVDAEQITILIARPDEGRLHRLASIGYTSQPNEEGSPTPFRTGEGLAGWIIHQRQSVLVDDVLEDPRWIRYPDTEKEWGDSFQHRSAMGVPLMSGAEALGCLLLYHPEPRHFSMDQLSLVQAATNQVAVAVNNAELYRLIRDQAEDLGNLLRTQQIETSRSRAILEAVADGVLVTDADRKITLFNESAEKILGLDRKQILGRSMEHFSGLFGRATRMWMQTVAKWSKDPSGSEPGDTFAEQFILEDGRVISVHLAPVSLQKDFLGTVSIFQDITHQVEVDRLKSEFVANVSHELRTPMTSIKGYVEILLMGAAGKLSDQQDKFLQIVKSNAERLTVLVNDLLDVSRIEAGRVVLSLQPLNLEHVLDQAIEDLLSRMESNEKEISIEKVIQPNLARVMGDPERIRRIFDNLLDNAYQYNLPNGRIIVRMKKVADEVQVDVSDTGVGIHPDDQESVFERFFRGESPLNLGVSGTGLGLSIVRNLVDMHHGRIWVESTGVPGEGSTFSFTIPIYDREAGT